MVILNHNSPKYREELWDACMDAATGFVFCNLCGGRVQATEPWHESHIGAPKALEGNSVGIAHKRCNEMDNLTFVIPLVVRAKRLYRRHVGITGPGLGDTPLPAGRRSSFTKKLNGKVEPRLTQSQKHARTMAQFPNRRPE